ncbi:hypothetical protein [Lentzea sp. NPDC055074]
MSGVLFAEFFVAFLIAACWALMIAASVKLHRFRRATGEREGWYWERPAVVWARVGNISFGAAAVLISPLPIIGAVSTAIVALAGCLVLMFVFTQVAGRAAGESEGAGP